MFPAGMFLFGGIINTKVQLLSGVESVLAGLVHMYRMTFLIGKWVVCRFLLYYHVIHHKESWAPDRSELIVERHSQNC